jgi:DNA-binding transcriptional ArsR family regulator
MVFNPEAGKIFDTAFYFTDYYYRDFASSKYISVYEDTEFMLKCLIFIRERTETMPDFLAPLASVNPGGTSPLLKFLKDERRKIDGNFDLNTVKKLFKNEKNEFYNIFVNHMFGNDLNIDELKTDAKLFMTKMDSLDKPADFKLKIAYILNDFDYAISVLAECFEKIYETVSELHAKYEKEILYTFEQINSGANLELYMQEFKYVPEKFTETTVGITLLNQFELFCSFNGSKAYMILGYRHTECFWNMGKAKTVDAKKFVITAGNDIRMDLIDLIAKNGKITISTLSKIMGVPITTVGRHVSGLRNDNIIYISKRDGLQLFYSINTSYFKRLKSAFDDYVDKTLTIANRSKNKQ